MFKGFDLLPPKPVGEKRAELFLGGIPQDATYNEIKSYFSQFGVLLDCRMKEDKLTNKFRGFAFVKYQDESSALTVLKKKHVIRGHAIDVKLATTKKENEDKTTDEIVRKVFLAQVHPKLSNYDIYNYFNTFDRVENINIKREGGYGFLTFKSRIGPMNVFEKGELHKIKGHKIECRPVLARDNLKAQTPAPAPISNQNLATNIKRTSLTTQSTKFSFEPSQKAFQQIGGPCNTSKQTQLPKPSFLAELSNSKSHKEPGSFEINTPRTEELDRTREPVERRREDDYTLKMIDESKISFLDTTAHTEEPSNQIKDHSMNNYDFESSTLNNTFQSENKGWMDQIDNEGEIDILKYIENIKSQLQSHKEME